MSETLSASTVTQERHLAFAVALMEHLAVPTFVLDAAHRVLVWNEACERLTALPASQMLGTDKHWQAFYEEPRACLADLVLQRNFDQGKPLYARFFDSYSVGGGVYAESWCWLPHRGQRRYLAVDAGPVFDEEGRLIAVVETLRDITDGRIPESVDVLTGRLQNQGEGNSELARRMLEHQICQESMEAAQVYSSVLPATGFSGDVVLAARSPEGAVYALLADATGHGLAAAVSILPVVQDFYALVDRSPPLIEMIETLNLLLAKSLPPGRFVAAAFVRIDEAVGSGEVWVGGIPDVLLLAEDGMLLRRFASHNLPLGITRVLTGGHGIERFHWRESCRLILASDGIVELCDPNGVQFGELGLIKSLQAVPVDQMVTKVHQALEAHAKGGVGHDDMSILILDCPARA